MKNQFFFFLFISLTFFNCKNNTSTNNGLPTGFNFVSNPIEVAEQKVTPLSIGADAPDFRLPGADGTFHSLHDYDGAKVLAVIFTCNHCPTAQAYEERIKNLVKDYADKKVQVVAISPNSPLGLLYEELGYSDLGDDFEDMVSKSIVGLWSCCYTSLFCF